jgi:hypothetical protein
LRDEVLLDRSRPNPQRPIVLMAPIWPLFGLITTQWGVKAIHPGAMPVILTTQADMTDCAA